MKWIGPILLVGVFLRHDTAQWLPGYTPQAWFYILGGLWEILLCFTIMLLMPKSALVIAALWIGILEGAQVSVCGTIVGDRPTPKGINECDYLSGLPIGATMTGLYLLIICWAIGKNWRSASR